jgi:hypothetical protein
MGTGCEVSESRMVKYLGNGNHSFATTTRIERALNLCWTELSAYFLPLECDGEPDPPIVSIDFGKRRACGAERPLYEVKPQGGSRWVRIKGRNLNKRV